VVTLGALTIRFFRTNHSIPDCLGIVFETPEGLVVHTGDFKFDLTPVNREAADLFKMAALGERGVLALLSESTNAERPGFTPSERLVGEHIEEAFDKAEGKIFISTFASNVHRLQQILDAARKKNRRVALIGRSMVNVVTIAANLGYLTLPEGLLVEAAEVMKLPPEQVVVLCTGSQGEPMAALSRIASANHRQVQVHPGDTVILAATPIPGNERNVARIVDNLFQLRAKVIYGSGSVTGMHVSGHASQEELKLMLSLIKPRYFIPIHGEFRMLHQHRLLAEAVGVAPENIFIVKNGDVVEISGGRARLGGTIPSGNTLVDGLGIGDVGNIVLRDRKHLSEDGILIVVLTLSKADGTILAGPDIISRGFVYIREAEQLMEEINRTVIVAVEKLNESNINGWSVYKQTIKDSIGNYLFTKIKRRPMILPIIIEV
jgi:ribonuclease J